MEFKVTINNLSDASNAMKNISNKLAGYSQEIKSVKNNLRFKIASIDTIGTKIGKISENTVACSNKINSMSTAVQNIANKYKNNEKQVCENTHNESAQNKASNSDSSKASNKSSNNDSNSKNGVLDYLWKVLKKAGHIGGGLSVAEGFYQGITNKDAVKITKTIKQAWDNIKNFNKDAKNLGKVKQMLHPDYMKTAWKRVLFGTSDYFKGLGGGVSKASGLSTRLYNNFQKSFSKELSKVSWKGILSTGVLNVVSNADEYKSGGISKGRAVAETITETAIDTGIGVFTTAASAAAVGAVAVALGASSAPVLAVAAGSIALTTVVDATAKWVTGSDEGFTELLSDFVLDKLGNCMRSGIKSISTKWETIFT